MKKTYETPVVQVLILEKEDIMTLSGAIDDMDHTGRY